MKLERMVVFNQWGRLVPAHVIRTGIRLACEMAQGAVADLVKSRRGRRMFAATLLTEMGRKTHPNEIEYSDFWEDQLGLTKENDG